MAAALAAQLPLLLKGVFYDGWKPDDKPFKMNRTEFVGEVERALHPPYGIEIAAAPSFEQSPEEIINGVLVAIQNCTDPSGIDKIKELLPKDIVQMLDEDISNI